MNSPDASMPVPLRLIKGLSRSRINFGARRLFARMYPNRHDARRRWSGQVRRIDGLRMLAGTVGHLEREILLTGAWEPSVTSAIERVLAPGDLAIDIGANIGCHCLTMARCVGPSGRVIAIEPNPRVRSSLRVNLEMNGIDWVDVLACAVGEREGEAVLKMPALTHELSANQGLSSLSALETPSDSVQVEVSTVDIIASRLRGPVKLAKVDTQGYDAKVIRGMDAILARDRPVILFEFEDWAWRLSGESLAELSSWLSHRQYGLWRLLEESGEVRRRPVGSEMPPHSDMLATHRSMEALFPSDRK